MDAQHSDQGLFPRDNELRFPLAVSQKPPTPWKSLVDGSEPIVLYQSSSAIFDCDVVQSDLLSRGWVFQEVVLTPANLFCTNGQMWWSCAHASLSQTFPLRSVAEINQAIIDTEYFDSRLSFFDSIRYMKSKIQGRAQGPQTAQSWAASWHSILSCYAATSVTFGDDRLVALMGISDLFRSLYAEQLGEVEYHSGLWSTNILPQLMWTNTSWRLKPSSGKRQPPVKTAKHTIPTWSPLKNLGGLHTSMSFPSGTVLLPNRIISMDTSQLAGDAFGRAADWKGCQMHLKGVLVNISLSTPICSGEEHGECHNRAHPTGHPEVPVDITWHDADLQKEALASLAPDNQFQGLAISVNLYNASEKVVFFAIYGIILKLSSGREDADTPQGGRRWMRCGSFRNPGSGPYGNNFVDGHNECHQKVIKYENAFQIAQKYGIRLELPENSTVGEWNEAKRDWRQRHLHDPELEDICII